MVTFMLNMTRPEMNQMGTHEDLENARRMTLRDS